jgi:hypothetical protein
VVDGVLAAFGGTADRPLHCPAQPVVQLRPHVGGVVADPGQPLDHHRDAVQGPQLSDEPVGVGALQQGLLDTGGEQGARHLRGRAGGTLGLHCVGAALPAGVSAAHGLGRHAELAGDLGLWDACGEQLGGAQLAGLQPVALLLCRRAASDGWHGRILAGREVKLHSATINPTPRTLPL